MTTQVVTAEKTRVQLDLSSKEILRLNWIMEICDLNTRKELFNNALTLLEWASKEIVEGRKIASFDDDTKDRFILSMPCLNSIQSHNSEGAQAFSVECAPAKNSGEESDDNQFATPSSSSVLA